MAEDHRPEPAEEVLARHRRAERLATLGTLAAGIAHEINNPLGLILIDTDEALESLHDPRAVEGLLRQIRGNVQRCVAIVDHVLKFARARAAEKTAVCLTDVLRSALDFTRGYARRRGVTIATRWGEDLPAILASATDLEQVFVNLIHNAVQACARGGTVTVVAEAAGAGVCGRVSDNGCGMTAEQRMHAFDPFYTTRQSAGGTGLGLSTCHGIVTEHRGTLEIESRPGAGTTVTVTLPAAGEPRGR